MNQLAKQALQFTIPAAMGYALGRHHAVSGSKHETLPAADAASFKPEKAPVPRVHVTEQNPMRSSTNTAGQVDKDNYPAKDFLPFVVPRTDYAGLLKKLGMGASEGK